MIRRGARAVRIPLPDLTSPRVVDDGSLNLPGTLTVAGETTLNGGAEITGALSVSGAANFTGAVSIATNTIIDGNLTLTGTLNGGNDITSITAGSGNLVIDPSSGDVVVDLSDNLTLGGADPSITFDLSTATVKISTFTQTSAGTSLVVKPDSGSVYVTSKDITNGEYLMLQQADNSDSYIRTIGGGDLYLGTGTTNRVKIDASGNIGIGTDTPTETLDISGTITLHGGTGSGALRLTYQGGATFIESGLNPSLGSSAPLYFTNYEANSVFATIDASGNMGIGTMTPTFALDITSDGLVTSGEYSDHSMAIRSKSMANDGGSSPTSMIMLFDADSSNNTCAIHSARYGYQTRPLLLNPRGGFVGINTTANPTAALYVNGDIIATGSITGSSKSFEIDHPVVPNTKLVHSCIEGPRCDLNYRGRKQLSGGVAIVDLETESTANGSVMSPGTFVALCTNPQVYLQNNETFDRVIGNVSGNLLTIRSENTASDAIIDWMVVAERHDPSIKLSDRTDENGLLVLEHSSTQ